MKFFTKKVPTFILGNLSAFYLGCLGDIHAAEKDNNLPIKAIQVKFENHQQFDKDDSALVLQRMQTKTGDPFNQETFDQDLKNLSDQYEWVDSKIQVDNHDEVVIQLIIKRKPTIKSFVISGSPFKNKTILMEGDFEPGMEYDQDEFRKGLAKIRAYLVKKGYFKSEVTYKIEPTLTPNVVQANILIKEGPQGKINRILFEGFSRKEEKDVANILHVKKYDPLFSWLTGHGVIRKEDFAMDTQLIVQYFQNRGYSNAHVEMHLEDLPRNKLALVISVDKGPKFTIQDISFSGFEIKGEKDLEKAAKLSPGDTYSPDKIRDAQERLRELYTQEGYAHTTVNYILKPNPEYHSYDVHFTIEESEKYKLGLVMVTGNYSTTKDVIYNNINLEPGDAFDSKKIKQTQERLQNLGLFKSVNAYQVRSDEDDSPSSQYRDVVIEVKEAQTGQFTMSAGLNATQGVFGVLNLQENNFNIAGLKNMWTKGIGAFRGGGQLFQAQGTIGSKDKNFNLNWIDPYFMDSLFRLGVDFNFLQNTIISNQYNIHSIGGNVSLLYPITAFWSAGVKFRVKDSYLKNNEEFQNLIKENTSLSNNASALAIDEANAYKNAGVVPAFGVLTGYDSRNNMLRPTRGFKSFLEGEVGLLLRSKKEQFNFQDFPFAKFAFLNTYYYPFMKKGVFKLRGDLQFIQILSDREIEVNGVRRKPSIDDFPLAERFFVGGEGTVRGYYPGRIGEDYSNDPTKPTGGLSSAIFSAEAGYQIIPPAQAFIFFDTGTVSTNPWTLPNFKMSVGAGLRLQIGGEGATMPFTIGYGYPINPDRDANGNRIESKLQTVFFSMSATY